MPELNASRTSSEEEYLGWLKEIDGLMATDQHSQDGEKFEALVAHIQKYEAEYYPVGEPDTAALIEHIKEAREGA